MGLLKKFQVHCLALVGNTLTMNPAQPNATAITPPKHRIKNTRAAK